MESQVFLLGTYHFSELGGQIHLSSGVKREPLMTKLFIVEMQSQLGQ